MKMKRLLWFGLSVFTVLAVILTGCKAEPTGTPPVSQTEMPAEVPSSPKCGGTLKVADYIEVESLSPTTWDLGGSLKQRSLYDSLIRWDESKSEFVPMLATSWEQESDTTWVFHLRQGVQFHKGYGELTADDVAFSINVALENNLPIVWQLAGIDHVEAVDRYTVRYHLQYPDVPFLFLGVNNMGVFSKAAYEKLGPDEFDRNPVGSGPFEFVEWVSGDHLTLRRFSDYWQEGMPCLDEIVFRFVPEASSRLALIVAGQVDVAESPDPSSIEQLASDPNIKVEEVPGFNWDALVFNMTLAPVDSKEVRQAIGYAIDRTALVEGVYFGHGTPDDDPLPQAFLAGSPDQQKYPDTADQAKAKELLAAAGYPDGLALSFMIDGSDERHVQIAQIVADQLADVGIDVSIEQVDTATYLNTMWASYTDMPYQMTVVHLALVAPDPDSAMYWFHHTNTDGWHGWANPEVDPLLEKGRQVSDTGQRVEIYRQLVDLILEDAPYVYIMNQNRIRASRNDVMNTFLSPIPWEADWSLTWLNR
jgi:peptide/nickel transport system substrate-binding protein